MIYNRSMFAVIFTAISLVGCGGGNDRNAETIFVYDDRMIVGCNFPGNISLEESTEELVSLGVGPVSSSCANLTNISFTESCFDLTGEIYAHEIFSANIVDLESSNFKNTADLSSHAFPDRYTIGPEGVSYKLTECM